MSEEGQLDERIRAALSRRADSVRVEPDLAGLAKHGDPRRTTTQRYPLLAVAIVLAVLAVTTVALEPVRAGDSRLIARWANRIDGADDPTPTTETTSSTSEPKRPKSSTTTTTTAADVPTTQVPPDGLTATTTPDESLDDGNGNGNGNGEGAGEKPVEGVPASPCSEVPGAAFSVPWENGDVLFLVEIGRTETYLRFAVWRDMSNPYPCIMRVTDSTGQPFVYNRPIPGPNEVQSVKCAPPMFEAVDGHSDDGVTWDFSHTGFTLNGTVAYPINEIPERFVLPGDRDIIDSLSQDGCDG